MIKLATLALCAALLAPAAALATIHNLAGGLDVAQATTCTTSSAQGTITATLDDVTGSFSFTITFGNNAPAFDDGLLTGGATETIKHFHGPAAPGVTGSIILGFTIPLGSPASGSTTLNATQITEVLGGLWYVDVHSFDCLGGEIRGQLLGDFDGDGIPDTDDSCPTVVNTGSDSETDPRLALGCTDVGVPYSFCTGPGTASPGDGVDAACDTCPDLQNPVIASPDGAPNRTRVSGQLDDDGDGVGNRCDFDHDQVGLFIAPSDFAQAVDTQTRAFPSVANSDCGLNLDPVFAMLPCGVFDHDSLGLLPSPLDFALDVEVQAGGLVQNGPSCGAACTPPFGGTIGSGTETLGKAICDGPRC